MRLLCKPTRTWSGNTLLAVVVLAGCIVTVVSLFVASGGSARRVCERLGLSNCYDPLPVVSQMAAFNPKHAVFATLSTVGAVLLRNSVVAFIASSIVDERNVLHGELAFRNLQRPALKSTKGCVS